jgi:hypothetical protein
MDGPNQINAARGSSDTIPRDDRVDAFVVSITDSKANQNRGPERNQLPQARPAELRSYTPSGCIISHPILGGLHHQYSRI